MENMKLLNKYKALYKGELRSKLTRYVLKKTKLIEKKYKLPENESFEYINYFEDLNKNYEQLQDYDIDFQNYELMGEKIDLLNYSFIDNSKEKKWFYLTLPKNKDVKIIWEINRLQFLPQMAISFLKTKDHELLKKIENIIKEWNAKNPYDIGINWYSNLEVAIRSISLLLTYILLYDYIKSKEIEELLYKHGFHLYKDIGYTQHCIPNNHLIGEATSLYLLGNIFNTKRSKRWISKSKKILLEYSNFLRDDGTFKEASLSYHRFVLQMYLLVYLFSNKFKDNFIQSIFENKLKSSIEFFKSIEKADKTYPTFGDWDDGVYYKLDPYKVTDFHHFVDTLSYFFTKNNPTIDNKILETIFEKIYIHSNLNPKNYHVFEQGKYGIYKDDKIYLFINNQDQFFHSHSDGLSVELCVNGKDILTDSGTYNYNLDKPLRSYFRSTRAHNTVFLGLDQSTQIGSFRWIEQPKTTLRKLDEIVGFEGIIYYKDKSFHKRKVIIESKEIIVEDEVYSNKHYIEINFHFSPKRQVEFTKNGMVRIDNEITMNITSPNNFETKIGDSYYSPSYNKIEKRKNLKVISKNENQKFLTKIQF